MIKIHFNNVDLFDDEHQVFLPTVEGGVYSFEHSLKAIADWEATYQKAFLVKDEKTPQEMFDYCRCMCLDPTFDSRLLGTKQEQTLLEYMATVPSATVIHRDNQPLPPGHFETSETIYATMFMMGIPKECENWNLYRLFNVIDVISSRNKPKQKMTPHEIMKQNHDLNEQRKKQFRTKG